MANENLKDEIIDEKELDSVTGGTIAETAADSFALYRRGLVEDPYVGSRRTRTVMNVMGHKYEDKGGLFKPNEYFDRLGNPVSREKFWEDFDKQHQTEAVPVADVIRERFSEAIENGLVKERVLCPA